MSRASKPRLRLFVLARRHSLSVYWAPWGALTPPITIAWSNREYRWSTLFWANRGSPTQHAGSPATWHKKCSWNNYRFSENWFSKLCWGHRWDSHAQGAQEYINHKGCCYSLWVNHRGRFVNMMVGCTGRVHNAWMSQKLGLCLQGEAGRLFLQNDSVINGVIVPTRIIEDPTYPLLTWVLKPYLDFRGPGKRFRYTLSNCMKVVECAFGRLKACWHGLQNHLEASVINKVHIIEDSWALHNVCKEEGKTFHQEWTQDTAEHLNWYVQTDSAPVVTGAGSTHAMEVWRGLCVHAYNGYAWSYPWEETKWHLKWLCVRYFL